MQTYYIKFDVDTGAVTNGTLNLPQDGAVMLEAQPFDEGVARPLAATHTFVLELFALNSIDLSDLSLKDGETYITNGQLTGWTRVAADNSHRKQVDMSTINPATGTIWGRLRFSEDGGAETVGAFFFVNTGYSAAPPPQPITLTEVQQYVSDLFGQIGGIPQLDDNGHLKTREYPAFSMATELAADITGGYFRAPRACQVDEVQVSLLAAPTGQNIQASIVDEAGVELVAADDLVVDGELTGRLVLGSALILAEGDEIQLKLDQVGNTFAGALLSGCWVITPR